MKQGGAAAMTSTGVNETLGMFFKSLQVSPGSTEVNKIHSMCLMPLFEDLLGGKMKTFALKDKCFWNKLLEKCFPNLQFSKDTDSAMNSILYTGTANSLPTSNDIPAHSISYDINKAGRLVTPKVNGTKFWVAVPYGFSLEGLNNLSFSGDYVEGSKMLMESTNINNGHYHLYWWDSVIPAKCIYQIILK